MTEQEQLAAGETAYLLHVLGTECERRLAIALRPLNLGAGQFRLLQAIDRAASAGGGKGAAVPAVLREMGGVTHSALSNALGRLSVPDVIQRIELENDARRVLLRLTPEGKALLQQALGLAATARMADRLTAKERRELHRLLGICHARPSAESGG